MSLSDFVKDRGLALGFDLIGIAPADVLQDLEYSRRWVAAGKSGEMAYLANPKREDPRRVLPSVQSVICAALNYNTPFPYSTTVNAGTGAGDAEPSRGWISRYAWGTDYHKIVRAKLEALRRELEQKGEHVETRVYVDTGPIVERAFARYSGIGWIGKNTCLINQQKGSWFFLGVILTNLALRPDLPAADRCGSCTRCLEACPTGALTEPYAMDASRCISYFTIEHRGSIPSEFRSAIGHNVFGCDICQDVCPWNSAGIGRSATTSSAPPDIDRGVRSAGVTEQPEFQPLEIESRAGTERPISRRAQAPAAKHGSSDFSLFNPSLERLASLTEDEFRRFFSHSPIKRVKFRGWMRNACIAMGNSGDLAFLPRLRELASSDDPVVREHAAWALHRISDLADAPTPPRRSAGPLAEMDASSEVRRTQEPENRAACSATSSRAAHLKV